MKDKPPCSAFDSEEVILSKIGLNLANVLSELRLILDNINDILHGVNAEKDVLR